MGLFRPRFTNTSSKQLFHSSGVVGDADAETLGATSAESFEQRQHLERSRRHIDGYRSAGVMHNYQKEARVQQSQHQVEARNEQEVSSRYTDGQRPSRVRGASLGRIDIVKPSRVTGGAGQNIPIRPSFQEPTRRGYNPYK